MISNVTYARAVRRVLALGVEGGSDRTVTIVSALASFTNSSGFRMP